MSAVELKRKCNSCAQTLPIAEYPKHRGYSRRRCKTCVAANKSRDYVKRKRQWDSLGKDGFERHAACVFKPCRDCKQILQGTKYHRSPLSKDGLSHLCAACTGAREKRRKAKKVAQREAVNYMQSITRFCCACEQIKMLADFSAGHKDCRPCRAAANKVYRKTTGAAVYSKQLHLAKTVHSDRVRNNYYRKNYDITLAQYNALHKEQKGCCYLCGEPEDHHRGNGWRLAVDHIERPDGAKIVRGLAHSGCNQAIGKLGDSAAQVARTAHALQEFTEAQWRHARGLPQVVDRYKIIFGDTPALVTDMERKKAVNE